MNRSYACLTILMLAITACAVWAGSAVQPCAASMCQEPSHGDPGMPADDPAMDEPPFDEPPPPGDRPHHPGGRGPECDHKRPGCLHEQGGPDEDELGRPCDEMCRRFLAIIKEKLPEHYARLDRLRTEKPHGFDRILRRLQPVVREYLDLVDEEPELAETIFEDFRIDERLRELGFAYREASERKDTQRLEELEKEIRGLVEKQATMSIARREARLRVAERRIKKQMERLQRHRERFEREKARMTDFVNDRVRDVMEGKPPRDKGRHGKGGRFGPGERGRQAGEARHRRGGEGRRDRRERMRDKRTPASEPQEESPQTADEQ